MNKYEKREDIIRVFPRRTKWTPDDNLVFFGSPGLFRPVDRNIPVKISVTFTWDIEEGERLLRSWSRPAIYKTIMKEGKEGEDSKLVPESLDLGSEIRNPKSKAVRRKRFMRERRKLYKQTKRFVDEVLRQNSPQRRKGRKERRGRD